MLSVVFFVSEILHSGFCHVEREREVQTVTE